MYKIRLFKIFMPKNHTKQVSKMKRLQIKTIFVHFHSIMHAECIMLMTIIFVTTSGC